MIYKFTQNFNVNKLWKYLLFGIYIYNRNFK